MKKTAIVLFVIILLIAGATAALMMNSKDNGAEKQKFITIEGIAQESVAGLVVSGALLDSLPAKDIEKYRGKYIEATGVVQENTCLDEIKKTGIQMQCFGGPSLTQIQSIKIIDK